MDGILGFGWLDHDRSPCLFKTLTQESRDDWGIKQPFEFRPMPRIFSLTASDNEAELQLGGYDPESIDGEVAWVPMSKHQDYGASVASITYGDGDDAVELLQFKGQEPGHYKMGYIGKFDSGTTCILMPNTTINGQLEQSPFEKLLQLQLEGKKRSLYYTFIDEQHRPVRLEIEYEHCVEPTAYRMILGDPFFKKYVVIHDMQDMNSKRMGLGLRKKSYDLSEEGDNDFLGAFAYDQDIPDPGDAAQPHHHAKKSSAMAALKEAARQERKELPSPQQSMREQDAKGRSSPYKLKANRLVTHPADGSLAEMRSSALREVKGPLLERTAMASGEAAPGSMDDIDDLEVQPSGEPWREKVDAFEDAERQDVMSNSVNKVRLHNDNHIVYTVDLGVGTPPQKRTVVFDTGSYVLGIFSKEPPAGTEPLLKDTMVSAAENDERKKYHVLDLQRSSPVHCTYCKHRDAARTRRPHARRQAQGVRVAHARAGWMPHAQVVLVNNSTGIPACCYGAGSILIYLIALVTLERESARASIRKHCPSLVAILAVESSIKSQFGVCVSTRLRGPSCLALCLSLLSLTLSH